MELVLLSVLGFVMFATFMAALQISAVVIFAAGIVYGYWYWDGSESDGKARRFVPSVRRTWIGPFLRWCLRHEIVQDPLRPVPPGPVLFVCRPHGILVVSAWLTFLTTNALSSRRPVLLAIHSIVFSLPLCRELALLLGCIDVSRDSIEAALAHGYSVAVLPGGVREMGPPVVPLPRVPGICKVAAEYAVPIIPVFFKGEEELFAVWAYEPFFLRWVRGWCIRHLRLPFPLFWLPRFWRRHTLRTHVGKALTDTSPLALSAQLLDAEVKLRGQ